MDYVLETKGLSKTYGRARALIGVDMKVPAGSVYGLVGKNGSGKTTLMRLVTGLASPSGGSFALYGAADGAGLREARKKIGAVIETPAVYPTMSAAGNLAMQCRIKGVRDRACIGELLETAGLADTGKKKARDFSLGQKARLALALALVGDPDFLLLDEPANGLDPEGIIEMRELLVHLSREKGKTILVSSHILSELSRVATHYGFINNGALIKEITAAGIQADDDAGLEEYYMRLIGGAQK
ncbi:MAG: ATP-binding cassette domain-containing protein [Spirochaetaceae bacterium]|jgi:ABC-2 type transport system ATP-binding protein|nr:ATP-binding cassette domain-containing protein [Spirochaetaceae bacterium]